MRLDQPFIIALIKLAAISGTHEDGLLLFWEKFFTTPKPWLVVFLNILAGFKETSSVEHRLNLINLMTKLINEGPKIDWNGIISLQNPESGLLQKVNCELKSQFIAP